MKKHLFDGLEGDDDFETLIGSKRAKQLLALELFPAKHHRYRRWRKDQILFVLEVIERLPRGAQVVLLSRFGITTAHLYYWRLRYIHRRRPKIGDKPHPLDIAAGRALPTNKK